METAFGVTSGIVAVVSYVPYVRDIIRGKTKPERASWLIWFVLGGIAFSSQLADGASNSLWLTGIQTVGVGVIVALSIKRGFGGLQRRDIAALVVAAIGLLIWAITDNPLTALAIVIVVDAAGALLTVAKAYADPATETMSTWVLAGVSGLLAMLAVGSADASLLAYPTYITVINVVLVITMVLGRRAGNRSAHADDVAGDHAGRV